MGYTKESIYALQLGHGSTAPNDSTTYYWGSVTIMIGNATGARVYIPHKGIIRKGYLNIFNGTQDCTAEDDTFSIRLNNTTDYAFYTGTAATGTYSNAALNIPVEAGDYILIKEVTPAWVTNPTGVYKNLSLLIEH